MSTVLNHLAHPFTYTTANGKTRVFSAKDASPIATFVLITLAAMIGEARYSSRSLTSSLVCTGIAVGVAFYVATAVLKILHKGEIPSSERRSKFSPIEESPALQGEDDFRIKPHWIDDEKYKKDLIAVERDFYASLWTRMYGEGVDVWVEEVEASGNNEKFRNGELKVTPGAPWASFAEHAREKMLVEWEKKGPVRRIFSSFLPFV